MLRAADRGKQKLPPSCVESFLKAGAKIKAEHVGSALEQKVDPEVVELFLKYADLNNLYKNQYLYAVAQWGGEDQYIKVLLKHGAKVDDKGLDGETALHLAVDRGA